MCGLLLERSKRLHFPLSLDDLPHGCGAERANQLVLEVFHADVEATALQLLRGQVPSEAGSFKAAAKVADLCRVAQPGEPDVEALRTQDREMTIDVLGAAHRNDRDSLAFEIPAPAPGERLERELVADAFNQGGGPYPEVAISPCVSIRRSHGPSPFQPSPDFGGGAIEEPKVTARAEGHGVSFRDAARFWVKLGFINFGGPTGQIALMHEELVERRRWIGDRRFLHALNYCMLLPGPEAQQLATYVGWLLHRVRGGLVAGIAFILPAFFLIMGLSWTYAVHGDVPAVAGVFTGLQAAVVGIVATAGIRVGRRALHNPLLLGIALAAFGAIFIGRVPFPFIVLGAAVIGLVGRRYLSELFEFHEIEADDAPTALRDDGPTSEDARPTLRRSLTVLLIGVVVWILPLVLIVLLSGAPKVLTQEAAFFSQAALVTFGGAYAALAYINQAAVQQYGWLLPGQMVTGLGLAESTPGPLIMVTEFVGFVGAYRNPGGLDPVLAGVLGATTATWATFAPCFLWIFLGAPYIERLRGNKALTAALSAITAAVVGVILNLAVTFGIHVLFTRVTAAEVLGRPLPVPALSSVNLFALVVAVAVFIALWRFRLNILWIVAASAVAGLIRALAQ